MSDHLLPSSHKILRFMIKTMSYGNIIKNTGVRDIQEDTGVNMKYVLNGIKQLCEIDVLRFTVAKGRRTYIINPTYYYKGTLRSIFKTTRDYNKYPQRDSELELISKENEDYEL